MFHFLGFLFIILIAILFIGLSIIGTVIRSVFGLGGRRSSNTYRNENGNYQSGKGYSFNDKQQSASPMKRLHTKKRPPHTPTHAKSSSRKMKENTWNLKKSKINGVCRQRNFSLMQRTHLPARLLRLRFRCRACGA